MERKPITIYLDNNHKQKNSLYQKKIILPKKYKQNSNSFKKIKTNNTFGQNMFLKQSENKSKINTYNIKEIKTTNIKSNDSNKKSNKIEINYNKNKFINNKKNINSIILIQKLFRGYIQRKKLKNIKSRIYLNFTHTKNVMSATNIFDAIKRNSKNQKEIIQLNNNRYNNRNTMSPNNNLKMNIIYKKNLILLKKDISRKKNYSFDYKAKDTNVQQNTSINPYKSKNKNITVNINKNKKNGIKGHLRIYSCGNINANNISNNNNNKTAKIKSTTNNNYNNIIFQNKNIKNKNNKSLLSSKQTKENSNSNSNLTSEHKSSKESPKINIIIKNNNKSNKNYKNKLNNNKIKNEKEENIIDIINKPFKTEECFEKMDTEEYEGGKKPNNINLINNSSAKYNFAPMIKTGEDSGNESKKSDKKKNSFIMNLDMPKFPTAKKLNIFESIKEEKIIENDNDNDTDLKSSFYDDEEFVIINYDYTLNDKKKLLKISRAEIFNIDGYHRRKLDFIKFLKRGIYTHAIKYVFNLLNNINKKKIEIDKTMTDNENVSFIQQERIEKNNTIFHQAQQDINNNE